MNAIAKSIAGKNDEDLAYHARAVLFNNKRESLVMLASLLAVHHGTNDAQRARRAFVQAYFDTTSDLAEFELQRADYDTERALKAELALFAAIDELADALVAASNDVD